MLADRVEQFINPNTGAAFEEKYCQTPLYC
jgi:hypothetical protein